MGISIQHYRARIGLFNLRKNVFRTCTKPTNQKPTRLLFSLRICPVLVFSLVLLISPSPGKAFPTQEYQNTHPCPIPRILYSSQIFKNIHPCRPVSRTFSACDEIHSSYIYTRVSNFQSRYVNGNKTSKGIKKAHWNKGNSHLMNKMPDIKNIVAKYHPQILGISEANLLDNHDQSLVAIPDFNMHVCPTITNPSIGNSRVVVYTHKDVIASSGLTSCAIPIALSG